MIAGKLAAFKPYLPVVKDCGFEERGCAYDGKYRYMNGDEISTGFYNSKTWYNMVLQDGSHVHFHNHFNSYLSHAFFITIDYDINGSAGPNRIGYDLFRFEIDCDKNKMIPYYSRFGASSKDIVDDCNKNSDGFDCAARILKNVKY